MVAPSIYVTEKDPDGVVITYRTSRKGYCTYLIGILEEIAEQFYDIRHLSVIQLPQEPSHDSSADGEKYLFRINFDNRDYMADQAIVKGIAERLSNNEKKPKTEHIDKVLPPVPGKIIMQLFPFTLIFRPDLKIIETGNKLKEMYPEGTFIGQSLPDVIKMRRPKLKITWENASCCISKTRTQFLTFISPFSQMFSLQKVMCEVELSPPHVAVTKEFGAIHSKETVVAHHLFLQGRTRYIEDWDAIIFLCNPLYNN